MSVGNRFVRPRTAGDRISEQFRSTCPEVGHDGLPQPGQIVEHGLLADAAHDVLDRLLLRGRVFFLEGAQLLRRRRGKVEREHGRKREPTLRAPEGEVPPVPGTAYVAVAARWGD